MVDAICMAHDILSSAGICYCGVSYSVLSGRYEETYTQFRIVDNVYSSPDKINVVQIKGSLVLPLPCFLMLQIFTCNMGGAWVQG